MILKHFGVLFRQDICAKLRLPQNLLTHLGSPNPSCWTRNICSRRLFQTTSLTFAGHSKWSNIKHIKASKDQERAQNFTRLYRMMGLAIRDNGGSADPKLNRGLADVIEQAKEANMPKDRIESFIKNFTKTKDNMEDIIFEARGPSGTGLIIESQTDSRKRTRNQLVYLLKKIPGITLVEHGIKHMFLYRGVINVPLQSNDGKKLDLEAALETAIEVGALDVIEEKDEEGLPVLQFLCDPLHYLVAKKSLEEQGYKLGECGLQYLPQHKIKLSDEELDSVQKGYDVLYEFEDVVRIYDNIA